MDKTQSTDPKRFKASKKSLLEVLEWKLQSKAKKWPRKFDNAIPHLKPIIESNEVIVTFINHSTALIQTSSLNILTDPVFSHRVGPFRWLGPKRARPAGMLLGELPPIHVVLVSHNHYDHMDLTSLKFLQQHHHPQFIVPKDNAKYFSNMKNPKIVELDLWQSYPIDNNNRITLTPAHHWSSRTLFDYCKALWGSFMIESSSHKIFFAGDTGYNTHFKEISDNFENIDISLLPIGAYEPRYFMKDAHMNPSDAVQAHLDLKSKQSIGIHFGTFQLTDEAIDDPILDLKKALKERSLSKESFLAPLNGQTIYFKK